MKSPSVAPGSPISVEWLVVAIRVLPLYMKGDQFVTSAGGTVHHFLIPKCRGQLFRYESVLRQCAAMKFIACAGAWAI
jgi:hypothetical protein